MAPVAGSAAAVTMVFIGWLPQQVMTERNLRPMLKFSRLN